MDQSHGQHFTSEQSHEPRDGIELRDKTDVVQMT